MAALMKYANKNLKEYFLDTKDTCFLCLIDLENNPRQGSIEIEKKQVRLSSLCRYLNISLPTALRGFEDHFGESKDFDGGRQYEFLVTLCFHCAFIVEEMDGLKWDQEIVRMELEQKDEELHKILEDSEKGKRKNDRWGKLQEKMKRNAVDPVETRLIDQMRNEIKRKCALKLQKVKASGFSELLLEDGTETEASKETVALTKQKDTPGLVKSEKRVKRTGDLENGGCGDKFTDKKSLDSHAWACSGIVNGMDCELTFESKSALRKHEREFEHGNGNASNKRKEKEWICQRENGGCGQKFSSRFVLMRHEKKRCPERKSIVNLPNAEQPKQKKTPERMPSGEKCEFCEGCFKTKKALRMHVQRVHQNTSTDRNEPSGEVDQDALNLFLSLGMPLSMARYLSTQI